MPEKIARLTVGHVVAASLDGLNDSANLHTECAMCNEPSKEQAARSESATEIWPKVRDLSRLEKSRLLSWINKNHRTRDDVDRLFDSYRTLPAMQRDEIKKKLEQAIQAKKEN